MNAANDNSLARWSHIELSSGTVTSASVESSEGVRALPGEVGKLIFVVEAVGAADVRLCLDSSSDYESAVRLAEQARVDFDIDFPVKDTVRGSH